MGSDRRSNQFPLLFCFDPLPVSPPESLPLAFAMTSQQSRRERASSDRAQAMPAAVRPQRPEMGSRASSAPAGELPQLDSGWKPSGPKIGQTLVEEDETPSAERNDVSNSSRSHHGDEVRTRIRGNNAVGKGLGEEQSGLLTAVWSAGTNQGQLPRGDDRSGGRRQCWEDQFHQMCA